MSGIHLKEKILSLVTVLKLILVTILFVCHTAGAVDNQAEEYEKLAMVNYFSIGSNGFIGHKSDGEYYVEKILLEKNSKKIFINIANAQASTLEAKLYAACGLRKVSMQNFDDLFESDFEKQVSVLRGDILRKEKFHEIYSWIQLHGCF